MKIKSIGNGWLAILAMILVLVSGSLGTATKAVWGSLGTATKLRISATFGSINLN